MQFDSTHLRNQQQLIEIDYQIDRLTRDLARKKPLVATGGATVGQIDDLEAELKRYQSSRVTALEALRLDEEFRDNQIARMKSALKTR